MIGAIIGDIVGSVYEGNPIKSTSFPLFGKRAVFTDDTVLTVAVAHAILERAGYAEALKHFGRRYPGAGYGGSFYEWLHRSENAPYNSWGNGSAMRVSPVGFAFDSIEAVLAEAEKSAAVTHNHPEGIKGAQATALGVYLARTGAPKEEIRREITDRFAYDLNRTLEEIRPSYRFMISCQESVPESIIAFLESTDYESAVRNAVSLGGDTDTMACIAGGIAQAYYKNIPREIIEEAEARLPADFMEIIGRFNKTFDVVC